MFLPLCFYVFLLLKSILSLFLVMLHPLLYFPLIFFIVWYNVPCSPLFAAYSAASISLFIFFLLSLLHIFFISLSFSQYCTFGAVHFCFISLLSSIADFVSSAIQSFSFCSLFPITFFCCFDQDIFDIVQYFFDPFFFLLLV